MSKEDEKQTAKKRDAALFRALSTPHKPYKPLKAKVDKSPANRKKKSDGTPAKKSRRSTSA